MVVKKEETAEERKLRLEAELLELDIKARKAEARVEREELAMREAEAKRNKLKAEVDTEYYERLRVRNEVHDARVVREDKLSQAFDDERVHHFTDVVDDLSASVLRRTLVTWENKDVIDGVKRPILLVFNSPGGNIIDGLDIFDTVMSMRNRGWKIDTLATGMAASMAGVLLQMGEVRKINRNATLHMHEAGTFTIGKTSEIKDDMKFTEALERKSAKIYADRSGKTVTQILNMWKRKEVFLSAEDAKRHNFVDEIV